MQSLSEDNFKVLIKVRPLQQKEKEQINAYDQSYSKKLKGSTGGKNIKLPPAAYAFYTKFYNCNIHQIIKINRNSNTIMIADPEYKNTDRKMKPFTYSAVFDANDQNQCIFKEQLKEHVASVLQGYNCTMLAYGITGSGKTYTIFGPQKHTQFQSRGISFQTFDYLLKQKKQIWQQQKTKVSYKFSFIEIYNENVRDLLAPSDSKYLNVVEDGKGNTNVADVSEVQIHSMDDIMQCLSTGTAKRVFASTMANQYSSRSHAILQLNVEIEKVNSEKTNSKLFIIDLAGSEKLQTLNCSKKMQQGANINRSLLALGNCINALAQNCRKNTVTHIPYRDSKLTRLLKDSLGGNTKTIMIACINPNPFLIQQTMTTLNYAMRAQGIQKKITRNSSEQLEKQKEFICLKCKKSNKEVQQEELNDEKKNHKKKLNISIFEQLYEDIVENTRENERLKQYSSCSNISNDTEWIKLMTTNEQHAIKLKEAFLKMAENMIKYNTLKQRQNNQRYQTVCSRPLDAIDTNIDNKQNECFKEGRSSVKSLNSSKSRRKRSHNKFEVPRRSDSNCKNITND